MSYTLTTHFKQVLADTFTPVSVYLKIRDRFPNSLLLENNDYRGSENSFSYICCNPIATIKIENETIYQSFPDKSIQKTPITAQTNIPQVIEHFGNQFKITQSDFKFINNCLFGYISYDAVRYFENIDISKKESSLDIPDMQYTVYQNIIAISNITNEAYIFAHCYNSESKIPEIESLLKVKNFASYNFTAVGDTTSNLNDEQYKEHVALA